MQTKHFQPHVSMAVAVCLILVGGCVNDGGGKLAFLSKLKSRATGDAPVLDSQQTDDVQLALGRTAEQHSQHWPVAMTIYRQLLKENPRHAEATHRLAVMHGRQGDFVESAQWFEKALELKPRDPDLLCDIGYGLYSQGQFNEAEVKFRQAIAISPHHLRAHNQLGLALAQLGRREDALAEFRRADCSPAQAHLNLALVLTLNDQTHAARHDLQFALDAKPDDSENQVRLAALESLIASRDVPPRSSLPKVEHYQTPAVGRSTDSQASGVQEVHQATFLHAASVPVSPPSEVTRLPAADRRGAPPAAAEHQLPMANQWQ